MKHKATPDFWEHYKALPSEIQKQANEKYKLLRLNPRHSSLRFRPVTSPYWSARVSKNYRAVAIHPESDVFVWFWIGTHTEYDQLIR